MYERTLTLAFAAVVLLGACTWETPQEVAVKGSPQVAVPTGSTVFELDFLDDIVTDFGDAVGAGAPASGQGEFSAGEKPEVGVGEDFTLEAELVVPTPDFQTVDAPDIDIPSGFSVTAEFEDNTSAIDLSDVLGPIPAAVDFVDTPEVDAPGIAQFTLDSNANATPDIELQLYASWSGSSGPAYLIGSSDSFEALASQSAGGTDFALEEVLNARPSDLVLSYRFRTEADDSQNIETLSLSFDVPFFFETTGTAFLDFADDNDDPLTMEDDVFGRSASSPDEDVQETLDALKGSRAEFVLQVENTTGAEVDLGIANAAPDDPSYDPQNEDNWVGDATLEAAEDTGVPGQEVRIGVAPEDLSAMIDAPQFVPKFMVKLPYDSSAPPEENRFSINKGGTFNVTQGYLVVEADVDYTYSFGD